MGVDRKDEIYEAINYINKAIVIITGIEEDIKDKRMHQVCDPLEESPKVRWFEHINNLLIEACMRLRR